MHETLTITRLGVTGKLKRTLASTNPCESMIETVRRASRNVKRWHNGDMCLRWTAAGMLEAEQQFRKIIGFNDLAELTIAVERDVAPSVSPPHQPAVTHLTRGAGVAANAVSDASLKTSVTNFHDERDILEWKEHRGYRRATKARRHPSATRDRTFLI